MTPRPYIADMEWLKVTHGQNSIEYKNSFYQQTVVKCNFVNARAATQGVSKAVVRSSARGIPHSGGSTWGPGGQVPPYKNPPPRLPPQHLRQLRYALFAILVSDVHMFA